jgi:hypothetical protein
MKRHITLYVLYVYLLLYQESTPGTFLSSTLLPTTMK